MTSKQTEIYEHLIALAENRAQPEVCWLGLCAELKQRFGIYGLKAILIVYPKPDTADEEYPLHTDAANYADAHLQYRTYRKAERNMWDAGTEYGEARRELCRWLATKLASGAWSPLYLGDHLSEGES